MKMAQHTVVTLVDDLDGTEAKNTISFGLDGKTYEIDLSDANTEKFRAAMGEFVKAARVIKRRPGRKLGVVESAGASAARAPRTDAQVKRAWLAENGFPAVAGKKGRFTAAQDRAWENRDVIDRAAQPVEEAATVADASPKDTGVVETSVEPRKGGRKGKKDQEQAPQVAELSGARTRISKVSSFGVAMLAKFAADLVVENGSTWALLKGSPEEAVAAIERVRATTPLETGEKRALAIVQRKLREGGANVKVA